MIDKTTGERIHNMEVYVSVIVNVTDCKTTSDAYWLSTEKANKMMDILDKEGFLISDYYEVFRNKNGEIADDEDEE